MLELRDLARRYGDVVALDGISFSVGAGQMFGFVGPNGAGKTTTMRIILGVLAPDRGEVRFEGAAVDFATRSRFGYMPEERGLYPKMRVRDQLVYLARLHGGEILGAVALALAWFLVGYAFYACAFAVAGALVPRQEELQSTMTPLSLILLVSLFLAFAVQGDPDGTLARVTAFIPTCAPITMPPRIVGGDASTLEIVASFVVTIGAAAALIPLAGRIYAGGVLRTGSAIALREAWRAAARA